MIIAIDGPAGTGKGTISRLISERLGFTYIDTGAMYRALTIKFIRESIRIDDIERIKSVLANTAISFNDNQEVLLDGENVTKIIRIPEVSELSSKISVIQIVREKLVSEQRKLGERKDVVMEGRDITTVVFPDAELKIYLTADEEERARRRYKEYIDKGMDISYEEVLQKIKERDYNDMHKEIGALKIAEDATVIDSTNLSIEEVYNKVVNLINKEEK